MYNDNQRSVYEGKKLRVEIFGASHAIEIGVIADGLDGQSFDKEKLQSFLNRRKPSSDAHSTKRKEDDQVVYKSKVDDGVICGKFEAVIKNNDQRSADYEKSRKIPRPSHADFVAFSKYGDGFDYRGGGKFSGRLTAPMCIVGGICKQILERKGVKINAFISSIGNVNGVNYDHIDQQSFCKEQIDEHFPALKDSDISSMKEEIERARKDLDSVGGTIDCVITGIPVGVGEYMFDSIEGVISRLMFAVPAVKGIEFGSGFELAKMYGSKANDAFYYQDGKVKTKTNHNGGINGGIANGMPITFRVAIKPTPSIGKEQDTVDLINQKNVKLKIEGRHDACIVPRAVPVIEAIASIAMHDLI